MHLFQTLGHIASFLFAFDAASLSVYFFSVSILLRAFHAMVPCLLKLGSPVR